jgi:hypothetical protein
MTARGVKNHWAKLDPEKVREIRTTFTELREKGRTQRQSLLYLASEYNTTPSNVFYIVTRATWRTVE